MIDIRWTIMNLRAVDKIFSFFNGFRPIRLRPPLPYLLSANKKIQKKIVFKRLNKYTNHVISLCNLQDRSICTEDNGLSHFYLPSNPFISRLEFIQNEGCPHTWAILVALLVSKTKTVNGEIFRTSSTDS